MSITILNTEYSHKWKCSLVVRSMYLILKVLVLNSCFNTFFINYPCPMGWWARMAFGGADRVHEEILNLNLNMSLNSARFGITSEKFEFKVESC
jgi:hypothetical protein